MDAPINIVVESPDAKAAELVGRAIGQSLRDNYGFNNVAVANIIADVPGFRAWNAYQDVEEQQETLLDAMREVNPNLFGVPVMIVSRESVVSDEINTLHEHINVTEVLGGIGLTGITAEEAAVLDDVTVEKVERQASGGNWHGSTDRFAGNNDLPEPK